MTVTMEITIALTAQTNSSRKHFFYKVFQEVIHDYPHFQFQPKQLKPQRRVSNQIGNNFANVK